MTAQGWGPRGGRPPVDIRDVFERFRGRFAGQRMPPLGGIGGIVVLVLALMLLWSSWYTVQPEETAIVQRFGKVVRTAGPGLHFKIPYGVETVRLVPTARVLKEEFGFRSEDPGRRTRYSPRQFDDESLMLTGDLNVIDVEWIVQFRISEPEKFLFQVREPIDTIRDVSQAVMRRVVGNRLGSDVLTVGRVSVATEVKDEMQKILDEYQTGIRLVTVELQNVTPPDPVKPAFNEVNEARQDKERRINEAQEQANKEIPKASGEAARTIAEAEGYGLERVNRAKGEANRFQAILAEYQKAPEVTRKRLYLEALTVILPEAKSLYIVDADQKALIPWLSLDSGLKPAPAEKQP
jgi:modulator of FtsH protease HflK